MEKVAGLTKKKTKTEPLVAPKIGKKHRIRCKWPICNEVHLNSVHTDIPKNTKGTTTLLFFHIWFLTISQIPQHGLSQSRKNYDILSAFSGDMKFRGILVKLSLFNQKIAFKNVRSRS